MVRKSQLNLCRQVTSNLTYQLEAEANVATGVCPATTLDYSPIATTYRKISS